MINLLERYSGPQAVADKSGLISQFLKRDLLGDANTFSGEISPVPDLCFLPAPSRGELSPQMGREETC